MFETRFAPAAVLAAVAAFVVLFLGGGAATAEDIYEKQEAKEAKLSEVRERKGVLTTTISRYRDRIERLTDEVAVLRGRLVAIYESGTPDILSVLVESGGYEELINRTEYLNRINGLDEAVVTRVRDLRDQIKSTVARLRSAKNRIESARDAIAAEEQALASARSAVQSRQAKLVSVRRQREAALATISDHEHEIEGDLAALQADIAARLQSTSSSPLPAGPVRYGSGSMVWPVDGPVVSGFGPRWGSLHEGIDIAVPAGTPIRAADAGSVVLVQSESGSGGYGNFTCLDHGGGLQTCYAHQSSFAVTSGSVSQGDVIGYVGCTGHCYGDHSISRCG